MPWSYRKRQSWNPNIGGLTLRAQLYSEGPKKRPSGQHPVKSLQYVIVWMAPNTYSPALSVLLMMQKAKRQRQFDSCSVGFQSVSLRPYENPGFRYVMGYLATSKETEAKNKNKNKKNANALGGF